MGTTTETSSPTSQPQDQQDTAVSTLINGKNEDMHGRDRKKHKTPTTNTPKPCSLWVFHHEDVVALQVPVDDGDLPAVQVQHPIRHVHGNPQPCPGRERRASVVEHLSQAASRAQLAHDPDSLGKRRRSEEKDWIWAPRVVW